MQKFALTLKKCKLGRARKAQWTCSRQTVQVPRQLSLSIPPRRLRRLPGTDSGNPLPGSIIPAMFCPECKAEYRSGFTRCVDCDVDLVQELSEELTQSREQLRKVWSGDSQSDCVEFCQELKDAGIMYEVSQIPLGPQSGMGVDWRFEIKVPHSLCDQARQLLNGNSDEIVALSADPRSTEQCDAARRTYLRGLHPGDAVVEILSKKRDDKSSIVELSLDTNLIRFRTERQDDGTVKLFVLPEDESRAREIVRQIKEGEPPG
jgi:hypothetical protein